MTTSAPGSGQPYPNPLDHPEAWDVFVLLGQPSPGRAIVDGAAALRKLDKKAGNGMSGATVTYTGDELCDFTVTIELCTTEDWDAWWQWRRLLAKPPKGAKASAQSCSHPALDALGISSCMLHAEHQPTPDGDDGKWIVKLDFIQWQKPTPALGTPQGGAIGDPANPTPQNAAEQAIAGLSAQLAALAGP